MKRHLLITALSAAFIAVSGTAYADNSFSLHLEPGLAQPLSPPQSNIYTTGMVLGAKGLFMLDHNISVGPSISTMYLPRSLDNGQNAGTLWQFGASARLQADRRTTAISEPNPWIDLDVMLANTGNLQRPAFDIGIGIETPLDRNRIVWYGPFLRYTHVFQTADTQDTTLLDSRDVNVLQAGLSFSFDTPTKPKKEVRVVVKELYAPCPHCNQHEVAVTPPAPFKELTLTEKVYFDWDRSTLRWESRDKLDAIVKQLNDAPTLTLLNTSSNTALHSTVCR